VASLQNQVNQSAVVVLLRDKEVKRKADSWDTRVNPTCEHGQTYANCSCNAGRDGKRTFLFDLNELREGRRKAMATYNQAVSNRDRTLNAGRRLYDEFEQRRLRYNQDVADWNNRSQGNGSSGNFGQPGRDYLPRPSPN
jgi:hypothetical protein